MTVRTVTARVIGFGAREDHVFVTLESRAGAYRIRAEGEGFGALVGRLADAWRLREPVQLDLVHGIEIVEVRP